MRLFRLFGEAFGKPLAFIRSRRHTDLLLLLVLVPLIVWPVSELAPHVLDWLLARIALSRQEVQLAALAVGLGGVAVYLALNRGEVWSGEQNLPDFGEAPERLSLVPLETEAQLREIQTRVVPEVFGSYTPPDEQVYRIFAKNRATTIGLFSADLNRFVGFATIWPLTPQAAAEIKAGKRVEEDLTADDVLPSEANAGAAHAIVPGIACIRDAARPGSRERGALLLTGFADFVLREYLSDRTHSLQLLASAYSKDGLRICNLVRMAPAGTFAHRVGPLGRLLRGRPMQLFYLDVSRPEMEKLRRRLRAIGRR